MSKKLSFLLFACLCFGPFSLKAQEIRYEGENNGVIMLAVSEFEVKKKDAVELAIKDAYFQILFRGIPGSKKNGRALLGTDENAVNKQYYDKMINGNRLYSFVTYSNLSYYKKKEAVVKVSLNVDALIADLEQHNLYRRLGLR